jgi:NAD-dependent dihydropyrimidine dehydrogenase PreA subunit
MRATEATFIGIEVDEEVAGDRDVAARLAEVCPVDIYAQAEDGGVAIVQENVDECVLCRLCIDASPAGTVRVRKLYDGGAELQ